MPNASDKSTIQSKGKALLAKLAPRLKPASVKDARVVARAVLGFLLLLNIIAALLLFKPWGGSAEDLERELIAKRQQLVQARASLALKKTIVSKVETARIEGNQFMDKYVLDRRTAYSSILGDLDKAAVDAGITPKESQFAVEPIEGSDTLGMMTISSGYEGAYANLTKFIHLLDKSPRFMIIESLQAQPQPTGQKLNVGIKLIAFVRDPSGAL